MEKLDFIHHLANLDLQPGATFEEIKRAYKDLVQVWHPDRFGHNSRLREKATERLQTINESYRFLESNKHYLSQFEKNHPTSEGANTFTKSTDSTQSSATVQSDSVSNNDKLNNFWWVGFLIGALFGHHITDTGWGALIFGIAGGIIGLVILSSRSKNK